MDSEEDRGIGENFCHPPLLLPLSRAGAEPEVPGLGAEPKFELPRVSGRDTELFSGRAGRDPMLDDAVFDDPVWDDLTLDDPATVCSPDWPKRRNPLFELTFEFTFERIFEPVFPGLATSRPLPVDRPVSDPPFCRLAFATCGRPSSTERDTAVLPRAEKNR
jgi:hypothetical protein